MNFGEPTREKGTGHEKEVAERRKNSKGAVVTFRGGELGGRMVARLLKGIFRRQSSLTIKGGRRPLRNPLTKKKSKIQS